MRAKGTKISLCPLSIRVLVIPNLRWGAAVQQTLFSTSALLALSAALRLHAPLGAYAALLLYERQYPRVKLVLIR